MLQQVPLAVADQPVPGGGQVRDVRGVRDAGQQRGRLLLLGRHGLDGLLLVLGEQEVAGGQLDGADGRGIAEAVQGAAVGSHQGPEVRLRVQVAGRLGLVVVVAPEARRQGGARGGAQAVGGLDPPQAVAVWVGGRARHHVRVQRVHGAMGAVVGVVLGGGGGGGGGR